MNNIRDILERGEWQAIDSASELRDYIHEVFTILAEDPLLDAAPDLLEALENTMTQLRRWRDEKPELWDEIIDPGMMDAWDKNRAAVARARGRSE